MDSHRDEKTQALLFPSVGYIWHPCDIKCKKCIGDDVVDGTGSTGSWHNAPDRLKLPVFVILILTGIFLEGVVHYHYGINIVYTQFYYLIVVVAGLVRKKNDRNSPLFRGSSGCRELGPGRDDPA